MTAWHESGLSLTQRRLGYILSIGATALIFLSGLMKWVPGSGALEPLKKIGLTDYAVWVGLVEMLCAALYWIPRTQFIGLLLLTSYVGAIFLAEMLIGAFPLPAIVLGLCIFTGTLLRKPSLLRR